MTCREPLLQWSPPHPFAPFHPLSVPSPLHKELHKPITADIKQEFPGPASSPLMSLPPIYGSLSGPLASSHNQIHVIPLHVKLTSPLLYRLARPIGRVSQVQAGASVGGLLGSLAPFSAAE